jgi:hypothetical protein
MFTKVGREQHARKMEKQKLLEMRATMHFDRLSLLVEELKACGLPGNGNSGRQLTFCNPTFLFILFRFFCEKEIPMDSLTFTLLFALLIFSQKNSSISFR